MKTHLILIAIVLALDLVLSGCSSLPQKITKLTQKGDFQRAFEILEKEGLSGIDVPEINPENNTDKKKLEARKIFRESAEKYYAQKREIQLGSGHAIKALEIIQEGTLTCPRELYQSLC